MLAEMAIDVLDNDDGAVDHHADRDHQAPQGHEIGGQAHLIHDDEGGQWRDHEGRRHDQRAPHIAEEQEEHDDDEHDAFEERLIDGAQGGDDQFETVVERHDAKASRQEFLLVDVFDLLFHRLDDFAGISPPEHENDAGHDLALPVQDGGAVPHGVADLHFGYVPYVHGSAVRFLDDDV